MITVIHKKNTKNIDSEIYIGRPSPLGNPFVIGKDGDRNNVIKLYKEWLHNKVYVEENSAVLRELHIIAERERNNKNTQLVCWCAPLACHGDVIKALVLHVIQRNK